jgi:AraC-like DNA-binding protein
MSRKIVNAELAEICGLSLQHFMKQFRAHYGMPPQEYIMRKRIRKARYTLLNTDLSIDAISESLGFCNTSHFIRRFSEATGMSPAKFRKNRI